MATTLDGKLALRKSQGQDAQGHLNRAPGGEAAGWFVGGLLRGPVLGLAELVF